MNKTQEFIQKAIKVHDGRYDYSKVIYVNNRTKIIIGCKNHDEIKEFTYQKNKIRLRLINLD